MNITGNLFIIAMITCTVLLSGFVITGIIISLFKHKSSPKKNTLSSREEDKSVSII
ncbi:MAG: hypothetical protein ACUZ8H_05815 [Candidatus Anammoxibacter sp.]